MWDLYKYQEVGIKLETVEGKVYRLENPYVVLKDGSKISLIGVDINDVEVCDKWLSTLPTL